MHELSFSEMVISKGYRKLKKRGLIFNIEELLWA